MGARAGQSPPRARGHAFQLTEEDANTASDVVTGMFLFIVLSIILWYAYVHVSDRYILSEFLSYSCVILLEHESVLRVSIF